MLDISSKRPQRGGAQGNPSSRSIADEIEDERKRNRHPVRKAMVALGAVLLLGGGAYAFLRGHQGGGDTLDASTSSSPQIASSSTPAPTPTPTPTAPPVVLPAPQSAGDREAAIAANNKIALCQMMLNTAITTSKNYNQMFIDAWKGWNANYVGQYDSQTALDSKQWYKNYIKKLYADYISANGTNYLKACYPSTTPLSAIMDQPKYEAW